MHWSGKRFAGCRWFRPQPAGNLQQHGCRSRHESPCAGWWPVHDTFNDSSMGGTRLSNYCGEGGGWSIHGDPRHAVVTDLFGASYCSARTAADSWPHPDWLLVPTWLTLHPRKRAAGRF